MDTAVDAGADAAAVLDAHHARNYGCILDCPAVDEFDRAQLTSLDICCRNDRFLFAVPSPSDMSDRVPHIGHDRQLVETDLHSLTVDELDVVPIACCMRIGYHAVTDGVDSTDWTADEGVADPTVTVADADPNVGTVLEDAGPIVLFADAMSFLYLQSKLKISEKLADSLLSYTSVCFFLLNIIPPLSSGLWAE